MIINQRVAAIFDQVKTLNNEDRQRLIDQTCANDPNLKAEVLSLLKAADIADNYFQNFSNRLNQLNTSQIDSQQPGLEQIGPWRLLFPIGRGGMGAVYLAERADHQYDRRVALKILPQGSGDPISRYRFKAEQQILAKLTHDNIARFLDGGVTNNGIPYFVMDYIEGLPIDEYCNNNQLTIRQRLELFLKVCDAVDYAHRHLVVHRDLKPNNVMVDEQGNCKLLDFGIAKVLETNSPSANLTQAAFRPMTRNYASPEMLRGENTDLTSDVYSLGVMFYQLLCGALPYPQLESILEQEKAFANFSPDKPSIIVANSSSNKSLGKKLQGDLDAIALKAIASDKTRRYQTVDQLATDIRQHLNGYPVRAQTDSLFYASKKLINRHRGATLTSIFIVFVLIGITGLSLRYANITSEQSRQISLQTERANTIKQFLIDMLKNADPNTGTADISVKQILINDFSTVKTSFNTDIDTKLELLQVFADVFEVLRLNALQQEADDLQLALMQENAKSNSTIYAKVLTNRARAEEKLGDYTAAFATTDQALKINSRLNERRGIAENYHQLGLLHHLKGEMDAAKPWYQKALSIRLAEFGEHGLEYADTLYELAVLNDELGEHQQAESDIRKTLAIRQDILGTQHSDLAEVLSALGTNLSRQNKLDEAIAANSQALEMYTQLFGLDNRYANVVINNLGHDYWRKGDLKRAKVEFEKTLALTRKYYPEHPDEGIVLVNISDVDYLLNDYTSALPNYRASLIVFENFMPNHPKIHMIRLRIGLCLGHLGQYDEAFSYIEPAFRDIEKSPMYKSTTTQFAAGEIIALYQAWGHPEKSTYYQKFIEL